MVYFSVTLHNIARRGSFLLWESETAGLAVLLAQSAVLPDWLAPTGMLLNFRGVGIMAIDGKMRSMEYARLIAGGSPLRALDHKELEHSELEAMIEAQKQRSATLPSDEQIQRRLSALDDRQLKGFARRLEQRLREETTVLDSLDAAGLHPFADDLRDVEVPFPVMYVSPEELQVMNRYPKRTSACYSGGTIFIGGELPELRDRLTTFATRGILTNDLFHEVYHGFQEGELTFASLEELLDYVTNPSPSVWRLALAESHAWTSCLPGFKDEVLMPVISRNYAIDEMEYLEAAFEVVSALRALGLSDREIGKLIGQADWDEDNRRYTGLMDEIERLAETHGHSPAEVASVVQKHKLMQRIQALRGMAIAAEICQDS